MKNERKGKYEGMDMEKKEKKGGRCKRTIGDMKRKESKEERNCEEERRRKTKGEIKSKRKK